jgi:hypothetical protein
MRPFAGIYASACLRGKSHMLVGLAQDQKASLASNYAGLLEDLPRVSMVQ